MPSRLSVWSASSSPGTAGSGICFTQTTMFMRLLLCARKRRAGDSGSPGHPRRNGPTGSSPATAGRYRRRRCRRRVDVLVVGAGPAGAAAGDHRPATGPRRPVSTRPRSRATRRAATGSPPRRCGCSSTSGRPAPTSPATWPSTRPCSSPERPRRSSPAPGGRRRARRRRPARELDAALVDAARRAGVDVREGGARRRVIDDQRRRRDARRPRRLGEARFVIAADGHWSPCGDACVAPDAPADLGDWHAFRQYFGGVDDERSGCSSNAICCPATRGCSRCPSGAPTSASACCAPTGAAASELKALLARPARAPDVRDRARRRPPSPRRRTAPGRSRPRYDPPRSPTGGCSSPATPPASSTR